MATVTGAWLLNDTLTFSITTGQESVVAISDGRQISGIQVNSNNLYYFFDDTVGSTTVYGRGHWGKESYKTLDFGTTEQTVSDNFYAWLTANAVSQDAEEPEDVLYSIYGSTLTGIADQVRRISGVDGELTPEQMTTNLLNVTPLGEYPKAEEAVFGIDSQGSEYGVQTEGNAFEHTEYTSRTFGYAFTAREAFSIVGFRHKQNNQSDKKMVLWDNSGAIIRSMVVDDAASDWIDYYFDVPVNVAVGETYTVSVWTYKPSGMRFNSTVFNSKLMNPSIRYNDFDAYPASNSGGFAYFAFVDIIIGTVQAELPNDYQITRNTMDDIAEEVQRITGTEGKMTTAQIITALQGVAVQSAE